MRGQSLYFGVMWLVLLWASAACTRSQQSLPSLTLPYEQVFAYDRDLPLQAQVKEQLRGNGYILYRVEFQSVRDERVPAWWCLPTGGAAPYPCVILMHGYGGDKNGLQLLAPLFALRGFSTFAIDAEYHGERKQPGSDFFSPYLYRSRDAFVQTVIDLRRAIDFLQSRREIDPKRIGYIGLSMGGILGGVLAGVDERVQAPVLVVAGGDWGYLFVHSQHSAAMQLRQRYPQIFSSPQTVNQVLGVVDPVNWVGRIAPRPLLMINGNGDNIVPRECSERLFQAAREPKEIVWLEGGHFPQPDAVLRKVDEWLRRHLLAQTDPAATP